MNQRWADWPLGVKALVVLTVPLVPFLLFGALVVSTAFDERTAQRDVTHTLEVKAHIATTTEMVMDAEAMVRGYALSRRPDTLERLNASSPRITAALADLGELIADNPTQVGRVQHLERLNADRPLAEIVQGVRAAPLPSWSGALERNRATVQEMRAIFGEMQATEDALLSQRGATATREWAFLVVSALLGAALAVCGGLLAARFFASGITRRLEEVQRNADRLARNEPLEPTADAGDELGQLSHRLRDVLALLTARIREAEEARQQLDARVAELAAVNNELEAFTYSVSHDLRSPLRHITGFASLLQRSAERSGTLDADERRWVTVIADAGRRMGCLIDDLLSFSRVGRAPVSMRRVDLNDVVREARREVMLDGDEGRINWRIGPLPDVTGDAGLLRLAFVNLLSNAVKYSRARTHPEIEVGANGGGGGETVVFVKDNGVGFDMQYASKLFGVFQRLHGADEFEGTGIGLANVRRIVQRHGGRAWGEGTPGEGATFFVALPAIGGPTA